MCSDTDDLIFDIRNAISEAERVELDQAMAAAPDRDARFAALLRSCWYAKGSDALARRVMDAR